MTSAAVHAVAEKPQPAVEFLESALSGPHPGALLIASVPAPLAPLEALFRAAPGEDAFLWHPPEGPSFSALAAAETLRAEGPQRIASIRRQAADLWAGATRIASGEPPPEARCFGGLSFEPGSASQAPWTAFGDARFVLPRFTYCHHQGQAWLSVAARHDEVSDSKQRSHILTWAESLLAALRSPGSQPVWHEREVLERLEMPESQWAELVQDIRQRIAASEFEKVVIARKSVWRFDAPMQPANVLEELSRSRDGSTRFAARFGASTFLGATPERLVRVRGLDVDSEALAGSSRPGDPGRAAQLLESTKERLEHGPVLREIVKALSPLCTELEHPQDPEVRELEHILHLRTPIRGRLAQPAHVLDLVERLHPTPAVGGVPSADAVKFIATHEPVERGWYASPIGWFDAKGEGEFVVGLRAGVLEGNRAHLYAGGGIVRGSDPASEYAETRLKLLALSAALHVVQ